MVKDEERLTAGAYRAMGVWLPREIADETLVSVTQRWDADTLHHQIEVMLPVEIDFVAVSVTVEAKR